MTKKRSAWMITLLVVAIIGALMGGCAATSGDKGGQSGSTEKQAENVTTPAAVLVKTIATSIQADQSTGNENDDGTVTYQITNGEEVAASLGVDHPKEVTLTLFDQESQPVSKSESDFIANITGPETVCGSISAARNSSANQSDNTVVNNVEAKGDVANGYVIDMDQGENPDVQSVSKAVGFDVTKQWQMSDPVQWALAPGETITMQEYPYYEEYHFDVMEHKLFGASKKMGSGTAYRCIGFCRVVGE